MCDARRRGNRHCLATSVCPKKSSRSLEHNLNGVGLFRTEFLFLQSHRRPSFDRQLQVYSSMADALGDLPMVIRTFDLGGDKLPPFLALDELRNSTSLHLRGLRFSLSEKNLLDAQLRAIVTGRTDRRCSCPVSNGDRQLRFCASGYVPWTVPWNNSMCCGDLRSAR